MTQIDAVPGVSNPKESVQNSLLLMQDKEQGAQTAVYMEILEDTSTGVTPSCAAAVEFGTGSSFVL